MLLKSTIGLMIITMLSKILGFIREIVLASSYGASMYSDAYLIAMNIPVVIFSIIGVTLETVLIPIYYEVCNNEKDGKSIEFINNILNIVIIICSILAILGLVFTPYIVKIFAIGFEGEAFKIAVEFTRIIILSIIFIGLSYIITTCLHIKNDFITPGIAIIPKNIIMIISIILSIKHGPYIMIIGTLIAIIFEFIFLLIFAIKNGYKYKLYINIKDKYIKKVVILILPVIVGVAVNQVNSMIDRTLASTLVEGSISALNYANKLNGFVMALFITSVSVVIYPILSKLSSENNDEEFIDAIVQCINSVMLLVIPISVGAIVLSNPIVKILFERGAFDTNATHMTSIALIMYSIGMFAFGLRDILGKVFYALQDTKTPMINGVIAVIMNIILNIILIKYLGLAGLPLATSISAIACIFLLFNSLKKKIGYFGQDKIINTTLKSIISAILMGIVTYFGYSLLSGILGSGFIYDTIALFGSVLLGAIVYGILIILLKVKEISTIINIINKKFNKRVEE